MLNVNTKLLELVEKKVITTDDFFILLAIAKRIDYNFTSFPSISLLMMESNFGRNKVYTCLKNLEDKGFLERKQRRVKSKNGREVFSSNLYQIKTDLVGVYVTAKNKQIDESVYLNQEKTLSQIGDSQKEEFQDDTLSINHSFLSINQSNLKRESTASKNLNPNPAPTPPPITKPHSLTLKEKIIEKREEVKANPLFESNRLKRFPDLDNDDIDLHVDTAFYSYQDRDLKLTTILSMLEEANTKKLRAEREKSYQNKKTNQYETQKPPVTEGEMKGYSCVNTIENGKLIKTYPDGSKYEELDDGTRIRIN